MANELVLTTTVADNIARVSKQEVKRAEEALLLRARLGHASARATADILNAGGIVNCRTTHPPQVMHSDLFFVKGLPLLLVVLQPLGLTMCSHIKNREARTLWAALNAMIA
jgi:hypothetical protein